MDERLSDLLRRARAQPDDATLRGQVEAALRRAGDEELLAQHYQFAFECDAVEDELTETGPDTTHCERCRESVYRVRTRRELAKRVTARQCVEIDPDQLPGVVEDLVRGELKTSEVDPLCVVPRWSYQPQPRSWFGWGKRLPRAEPPAPDGPAFADMEEALEDLFSLVVVEVPVERRGWVARVVGELAEGRTDERFEFFLPVGGAHTGPLPERRWAGLLESMVLRVRPDRHPQGPPAWRPGTRIRQHLRRSALRGKVTFGG